jgi:hypothetical protein
MFFQDYTLLRGVEEKVYLFRDVKDFRQIAYVIKF